MLNILKDIALLCIIISRDVIKYQKIECIVSYNRYNKRLLAHVISDSYASKRWFFMEAYILRDMRTDNIKWLLYKLSFGDMYRQ